MVKVKVCGITNLEDAQKAVYYGAWAIGFIFHKKSPRYISPSKAKKIIDELPPFITPVGVFVNLNETAVREVCRFTQIHTIQLHGEETPVYCKRFKGFTIIKAFRVGNDDFDMRKLKEYNVNAYMFDTLQEGLEGGTGQTFNWDLIKGLKADKPIILSGGLNTENITTAIDTVKPYAVDVNSGLEKSPGIKDPRKIRAFFENVNTYKPVIVPEN